MRAAALLVIIGLLLPSRGAADLEQKQLELKAAIVQQFVRFVRWPEELLPGEGEPFVLCILDRQALADRLVLMVRDQQVQKRSLEVRPVQHPTAACHLLFIGSRQAGDRERIRREVLAQPILTVGDADDFAIRGGMIEIYWKAGRAKLRINRQAVEHASLRITSRLLALAEIIEGPRQAKH